MTAMRKRPRSDTQAEQSGIAGAASPRSKKKQRNGAGGRSTNTDLSDKVAQQAHGSSMKAINRDVVGHDDLDLSVKGMRNSKDQDHVLVMTSQNNKIYSQLTTARRQLYHTRASSIGSGVRRIIHIITIQRLLSRCASSPRLLPR